MKYTDSRSDSSMEETNLPVPENSLDLVKQTFVEMGFTDENPDDLKIVADILDMWKKSDFDDTTDFEYTQDQYVLLNDPDVMNVLNKCRQYYEPKRHLTKGDLRTILEQIAQGKLTRQDWDFKNGEPVTMEPSFTERIQAIKMLQEGADDNDNKATIQFINNLVMPDGSVPKPNLDAPDAPPEGHYSLNMQDEGDE